MNVYALVIGLSQRRKKGKEEERVRGILGRYNSSQEITSRVCHESALTLYQRKYRILAVRVGT